MSIIIIIIILLTGCVSSGNSEFVSSQQRIEQLKAESEQAQRVFENRPVRTERFFTSDGLVEAEVRLLHDDDIEVVFRNVGTEVAKLMPKLWTYQSIWGPVAMIPREYLGREYQPEPIVLAQGGTLRVVLIPAKAAGKFPMDLVGASFVFLYEAGSERFIVVTTANKVIK